MQACTDTHTTHRSTHTRRCTQMQARTDTRMTQAHTHRRRHTLVGAQRSLQTRRGALSALQDGGWLCAAPHSPVTPTQAELARCPVRVYSERGSVEPRAVTTRFIVSAGTTQPARASPCMDVPDQCSQATVGGTLASPRGGCCRGRRVRAAASCTPCVGLGCAHKPHVFSCRMFAEPNLRPFLN